MWWLIRMERFKINLHETVIVWMMCVVTSQTYDKWPLDVNDDHNGDWTSVSDCSADCWLVPCFTSILITRLLTGNMNTPTLGQSNKIGNLPPCYHASWHLPSTQWNYKSTFTARSKIMFKSHENQSKNKPKWLRSRD